MVRIRLRRVGKRKQPIYRVVVADSRSPRDGRFIEVIGQYKPLQNPSEIVFEQEKALEWLRKGAQPSASVIALLKRSGIWTEFVKDKGPAPKKPKKAKKGVPVAVAAAPAAAEAPPAAAAPPAEAEAPAAEAPAEEAPPADANASAE